jgi:hypothetical protein
MERKAVSGRDLGSQPHHQQAGSCGLGTCHAELTPALPRQHSTPPPPHGAQAIAAELNKIHTTSLADLRSSTASIHQRLQALQEQEAGLLDHEAQGQAELAGLGPMCLSPKRPSQLERHAMSRNINVTQCHAMTLQRHSMSRGFASSLLEHGG